MPNLEVTDDKAHLLEQVLIQGDLSKLNPQQLTSHLQTVCHSLGLNPLTRPFEYIKLNGKLTLYAKRDATDQLRKIHKVSVKIKARELVEDVYVVTAEASTPDGRTDESVGAVPIAGLKGDAKANALMKAETKAKRRVTLSFCGLGFLDESEVESIPEARLTLVNAPASVIEPNTHTQGELGDYVVPIGKKYKGMRLKDISPLDLQSFRDWLYRSAEEKKQPLTNGAAEFYDMATEYLNSLRQPKLLEDEPAPEFAHPPNDGVPF